MVKFVISFEFYSETIQQYTEICNMSAAFIPQNIRSSGNTASKQTVNPETIQKLLDENCHLIKCISDYQAKGKIQECSQYQQILHRNLVWLATVADSNQSGNQQNMLGGSGIGGKVQSEPSVSLPSSLPTTQQFQNQNPSATLPTVTSGVSMPLSSTAAPQQTNAYSQFHNQPNPLATAKQEYPPNPIAPSKQDYQHNIAHHQQVQVSSQQPYQQHPPQQHPMQQVPQPQTMPPHSVTQHSSSMPHGMQNQGVPQQSMPPMSQMQTQPVQQLPPPMQPLQQSHTGAQQVPQTVQKIPQPPMQQTPMVQSTMSQPMQQPQQQHMQIPQSQQMTSQYGGQPPMQQQTSAQAISQQPHVPHMPPMQYQQQGQQQPPPTSFPSHSVYGTYQQQQQQPHLNYGQPVPQQSQPYQQQPQYTQGQYGYPHQ